MAKSPTEPLRGEAAWRAAKQEISDRNEQAFARGRRERAARDARASTRRVEAERHSMTDLPRQRAR